MLFLAYFGFETSSTTNQTTTLNKHVFLFISRIICMGCTLICYGVFLLQKCLPISFRVPSQKVIGLHRPGLPFDAMYGFVLPTTWITHQCVVIFDSSPHHMALYHYIDSFQCTLLKYPEPSMICIEHIAWNRAWWHIYVFIQAMVWCFSSTELLPELMLT